MPVSTSLVAERLAGFVGEFDLAHCPPTVVSQARRVLMDTMGCMVAGSQTAVVSKLMSVLAQWGGDPPECTIPGRVERPSLLSAALVNGTKAYTRVRCSTTGERGLRRTRDT